MKFGVLGSGLVLLIVGTSALGQQTLIGKYSGNYQGHDSKGNERSVGLQLEITAVDGESVKGKATRFARGCGGEYPVEGSFKDSQLELKSVEKGGPAGDCALSLKLKVEGGKLAGTIGRLNIEMSKQ